MENSKDAERSGNVKMKKHGHYCKICGEYKANEKFSGKGHAAHICKKCAAMPLDERNEAETVTRIENLPFYLSKEQIAWLKKKQGDKRPDVAALAKEAFSMRFPFAERNAQKKQLRIEILDFSVNGEIYNDEFDIPERIAFTVDSVAKTIKMNSNGESTIVTLMQKEMTSLVRYIINELEIFCWQEDYLREYTEYVPTVINLTYTRILSSTQPHSTAIINSATSSAQAGLLRDLAI